MKTKLSITLLKSIFTENFVLLYNKDPKVVKSCLSIVEHFTSLAKASGVRQAIMVHKETERVLKQTFLFQKNIQFDHSIQWVRTGSSGIPKFVKFRKSFIESPEYARAMLTAIAFYRLFTLPVSDDIKTITTPGQELRQELLLELEQFAKKFYESKGIKPFEPVDTPFPAYATTKAGANGPSAMALTSLKDAISVERSGILPKIRELSSLVYKSESHDLLMSIIDDSLSKAQISLGEFLSKGIFKTGRLHLLAEGGGKTRVVAIPDIWSQSVIKPIHQFLMNSVLSRMPCDGTSSHSDLAIRVRSLTASRLKSRRKLFCFDLTAATDRFPLEVIVAVLKPLLGPTVHVWADLMVNRLFTFKNELIRYSVGQPMGLLSSWASFSVAHHIIINYCKGDKSPYAVIGDDMVMSSEEGAKRYRQLLSELGVSINDSKSLIPNSDRSCAEIAKRLFREGEELSPIPPRVLIESTKSLSGLLEFLEVLASRTNKFGVLSELELDCVRNLIVSNKEYNTDQFQVTMTCPLIEYSPMGQYLDLVAPLIEGNQPKWNTQFPAQTYKNEFDSFLLNEWAMAIAMNPLNTMYSVASSPGHKETVDMPLLNLYMNNRFNELQPLLRVAGAGYIDGEDDDFVITPDVVYRTLTSGPDPSSPRDFMEKRKIRRKQTVDLIYRFYQQSRYAKLPIRPKP